jgi:hypothetical protein
MSLVHCESSMSLVPVAACRWLSLVWLSLVCRWFCRWFLSLVHCKSNQTHLNKHSKFKNYAAAQFF